jgi:hypothetical protein
MKRLVLLLVIATVVVGGVFAEEKAANSHNNWISGELNILGVGLRYERMLSPNFSIGANAYVNTLIIAANAGVSAVARYYPWAKTFYLELGVGFGSSSGLGTEVTIIEKGTGTESTWGGVTTTGVIINPGLGWKIDVGEPGGFFINPGIIVPIAIGTQTPFSVFGVGDGFATDRYDVKKQTGVNTGFVVYFGMGFAF